MGYILPVHQYQYKDYQTRIIRQERSPFTLDKIHRASLVNDNRSHHQDQVDRRQTAPLHMTEKTHAIDQLENSTATYKAEKILSNMTGKGRHFSETV